MPYHALNMLINNEGNMILLSTVNDPGFATVYPSDKMRDQQTI